MARRCVLLGWSGADWALAQPLIDGGKMPHLARLLAGGTRAETLGFAPYSSPMSWATIATGRHPDRHGVLGYAAVSGPRARPAGTSDRRAKALWTIASENGKSAAVVGWPCSFPAEPIAGPFVSDAFAFAPGPPGGERPSVESCVHPRSLADELEDFRLGPGDVDPGLLGLFVPELRTKGIQQDPRLAFLQSHLAELYSLHNAAVVLLGRLQPDLAALHFSFLRQISEQFLLYHPPRHPRVNRRDQVRYGEVVEAAYRLQDALLGDLLRHVGPDTVVVICSDHGFTTGEQAPGPALPAPDANPASPGAYRPQGIFVACGPGIRPARVDPIRLTEIAPMILTWLGGLVADAVPAAAPVLAAEGDQDHLGRILVARRLLPEGAFESSEGRQWVERQNGMALGTALLELGRPRDALSSLQTAAMDEPESRIAARPLVRALLDSRMVHRAAIAAQPIFDYGPDPDLQLLILAHSHRQREAVDVFQAEIKKTPQRALLYVGLGNALLRTGRRAEAIAALEEALAMDARLEIARSLLSEARSRLGAQGHTASPSWEELAERARSAAASEREYRSREERMLAERGRNRAPAAAADGPWVIRPPWPDEAGRLRKYFKLEFAAERAGPLGRWVIEARQPERIVGVALLREASFENVPAIDFAGGRLMEWEARAAWEAQPAAEALLRAVMLQAQRLGPAPLFTSVSSSAAKELARRLGFTTVMRREIGLMSSQRQREQILRRFGEKLKGFPIAISPIGQADPATVAAITQHHRLREARVVRPAAPGSHAGYDPDLSLFAGSPERPAIILLAREHLGEVYLDILARNPDVPDFPRLGIMALLVRFAEVLAEKGFDRTFYQVTAGARAGLASIIHRTEAQPTQFQELMLWQRQASFI